MGVRRWWFLAVSSAAVVVAVLLVRGGHLSRAPHLGPLEATPPATQLSVRIGEAVRFSAAAEGAVGFTWLRWGRPMSFEPTWSYVPSPEDAGWQHVTVEVTGRGGLKVARTWDVGVVAPVAPEIDELTPAAGPLALASGDPTTFRCRAHVPGGRASDRLAFEWMLDDRPVLREEVPGSEGVSELAFPRAEPGTHRLRLRVTEDGRTASLADWVIEVAPGAPVREAALPPPPAETPTTVPAPPSRPAPSGPARLVRAPGPRLLDAEVGESLAFWAHVEPESAEVSYRWRLDGKVLPTESAPRLEYRPEKPGPHEVAVTVMADGRALGEDAWEIEVRAPRVAKAPAEVPDVPAPVGPPLPRLVRAPGPRRLDGELGRPLVFKTRVEPADTTVVYKWSVDGRPLAGPQAGALEYAPSEPGRHTIAVTAEADRRPLGRDAWVVDVRLPEAIVPPPVAALEPPPTVAPPKPPPGLAEDDVRRWLEEYARAWSRKDVSALRRMGQVRSGAEADRLERYFQSIDALQVDVRVLRLTLEGERASVEFERTDTVTDPGGRRQQLRLPPIRKQIERTPEGLRFTEQGARG